MPGYHGQGRRQSLGSLTAVGLAPEEYGTHSMRRTKASLLYKSTGNHPNPVWHGKIENVLGIWAWTSMMLGH